MTSVFSATPPADQPPASIDVPPAARDHADRWDWLRATAFFCVAVFLLNAIAAVLRGWTLFGWVIIPDLRLFLMQNGQILAIGDLVLPAALLIAGSALSDHTFWGVTGRERLWSVGRIVLALGIVAAVAGLALTFGNSIYQALLPPPFARIRAPLWLLNGTEHGLVFGVALPFVFRRLSQRTGRAWLVGLLGAMLLAGGMLGLYSHLATPLRWVTNAWMKHLPIEDPVIYDIPIHDLQEIRCFPGSITGCFGPQAQTWVVAGILPIVVALLLGALIGAPLAYPYGTREARAPEAAERAAHPQQAQGEGRLRWALGIGAGSLLVGLVAMGTRLYAIYKLMLPRDNYLNIPPFIDLAIVFGTLAIVQLVPFGILALLGAIRLMRLPRGGRPAAWSVGVLALVCVLGLLPTLIPAVFPFPTGT
ncbi:MAG: hypothetical protein ACXVDI_20095, partial [Ktedonobacterales bacterium]